MPDPLDILTNGAGALLFGAFRPLSWLAIAVGGFKATGLTRASRGMIVSGATGLVIATSIYGLANAGLDPVGTFNREGVLLNFAELLVTPSQVVFTIGFLSVLIRFAGLRFGPPRGRLH